MPSLTSAFLTEIHFGNADMASIHRLGEYLGKQTLFRQQMPEVLDTLIEQARVESAESSNRLEGIKAPHFQIEKMVLKLVEPRNRSEQEIAGYRDVLEMHHERAEHIPMTPNVILQLHQKLYGYLPGEGGHWKMTDNEIVERDGRGNVTRVRFKPVPAVVAPSAMDALCSALKERSGAGAPEALVLIPLFVLDFLCIHPFRDGNGRMARLLTLQLLYQSGYEVGRYISLERVIEEAKEGYYETLEISSQNWHESRHDPMPWLRYFWGTLLKAYKEFEERVGVVARSVGGKSHRVREAVLRQIAPFSISEIERICPGISRETIRNVLREMRDGKIIGPTGKGRGAKWFNL